MDHPLNTKATPPKFGTLNSTLRAGVMAASLIALAGSAQADWAQTAAGTYDFFTGTNWSNGTPNGIFPSSLTLTGAQTITFNKDWATTAAGLQILEGGAYALTLRGDGVAARKLTLAGDVSAEIAGSSSGTASIGSSTASQALNVDLGGTSRTFYVGGATWAVDLLKVYNNISNGSLVKTGVGTLQLSGANSYTGDTTVKNGVLLLNSSATLGSENIYVSTTGKYTGNDGETITKLSIDNTSGSNSNRISDTAKIFLNSGAFVLSNPNNTSITENVGTITLEGGANVLEAYRNGSSGTVLINAASLVRTNQAVLRISGAGLGASGSSQIKVTDSSSLTSAMIGGGGAAGSMNVSIIPWVTGVTQGTRSARAASSFGTYDTTNGFRYLSPTTEFRQGLSAATSTSTDATTDNVRVTASENISANTTINSLLFDTTAGLTIGGAYKLTVTSGALFSRTSDNYTNNVTVNSLDFAGNEAVIGVESASIAPSTLSITGVITNTGGKGLTKYGAGELQLSGANDYTGDTVVTEGRLRSKGNAIPDASNLRVSLLGTFVLNSGATEQVKSLAGLGSVYLDATSARINVGTGAMAGTAGKITVGAGGILSPGDPSGSMEAGLLSLGVASTKPTGLELLSGAELDIDIASLTQYDAVALLNGGATLGGTLNITLLNDFIPEDNDRFKIMTTTGGIQGNFDAIMLSGQQTGQFSTEISGNDLYLVYSVVPEPSTYAMVLGGLGALLGMRRMRRGSR